MKHLPEEGQRNICQDQGDVRRTRRRREGNCTYPNGRSGFLKRQPAPAQGTTRQSVSLSPVIVAKNGPTFSITITVRQEEDAEQEATALINSGAGGVFMNKKFTEEKGFKQIPLQKQIRVFNVDRTKNKIGSITHCTWVKTKIGEQETNT